MTEHQPRDVRRDQILQSAAKLFVSKGYENAAVDEIAKDAGLSKGSIYWYFRSKLDILFELTDRFVAESQAEVVRLADVDQMGPEALYRSHREIYRNQLERSDRTQLFHQLISLSNQYPEIKQRLAHYHREWDRTTSSLIERGVERGHFLPTNGMYIAQAIHALYDGLCMRKEFEPDIDVIAVIEYATKLFYEALTCRRAAEIEIEA